MRLPKSIVIDPQRNGVFALAAMSVSIFAFAYSTDFGKIAILALYACWLPAFVLEPRILARDFHRVLPILILPGLALFSTLWSDRPDVTLRAAIQYGSTFFCGLVAARIVTLPMLSLGGLIGSIVVLAYSFTHGHYAYDVVDGSYAFAGAFASKNQLGYFASLAFIFAVSTFWLYRSSVFWRVVAAGVGLTALLTLAKADSATSTLTTIGALGLILIGRVLFALPPMARRVAIAIGIVFFAGGMILAWRLGAFEQLFQVFGKDATLTGRTYLWRRGIEIGGENPFAGLGYYAFWTIGRPEAEKLWTLFYITARTGFHFHNTLVEAYVELGLVGLTAAIGFLIALVVMPMRVLLNRRLRSSAIVCTALSLLFVVRAMVEIDFLTPYTAGSFLVPFLLLKMADHRAIEIARLSSGAPPGRRWLQRRAALAR